VVHHLSPSLAGSFFLLAVFQQSYFCLTKELVGIALHSVLGGSPSEYHIGFIKPCNFYFSVASRAVGLLKVSEKHITTEFFDVYINLWRDGGANCKLEFRKWEEEEEACTLVTRKKKDAASKQVHFASPSGNVRLNSNLLLL
jgi:hypothetical protein